MTCGRGKQWILLLGASLVCGCAGLGEELTTVPPDYSVRKTGAAVVQPPSAEELAPKHPSFRVIKGTPVESVEDAKRLLEKKAGRERLGLDTVLRSCALHEAKVRILAELFTEISGYNVVASNAVADRTISIYLKNIPMREALESVCRLNGLWFREGKGIITLMTRDEYVRDIEARQSDQTRAFFVRYSNALDMAKVITAAMGDEVRLTIIDDEKIYGHLDPSTTTSSTGTSSGAASTGQSESLNLSAAQLKTAGLSPATATPAQAAGGKGDAKGGEVQAAAAPAAQGTRPLLAILTVFKRNNCIIARSLDGALLNEMGRIIETLDTPTNQVLLEVKILQLTLNDGFDSFFRFNYVDSGSTGALGDFVTGVGLGGASVMGSTAFNFVFDSDKLDARIAFFESKGRVQMFSTPFLMAANNSKVEFFVGEETPLRDEVTSKTVTIGQDANNTINTFEVKIKREDLGTDVEMTTFINDDGTVTMEVDAEISSAYLNFSTTKVVNNVTGETIEYPLDGTSKTNLKSILSARSGQSIAIGGIIKETMDRSTKKVPLLGDIPGLGLFFRDVVNSKKKTETVIIITPHVIAHPSLAGRVSDEFLGRKSSHEHITRGRENILDDGERDLP